MPKTFCKQHSTIFTFPPHDADTKGRPRMQGIRQPVHPPFANGRPVPRSSAASPRGRHRSGHLLLAIPPRHVRREDTLDRPGRVRAILPDQQSVQSLVVVRRLARARSVRYLGLGRDMHLADRRGAVRSGSGSDVESPQGRGHHESEGDHRMLERSHRPAVLQCHRLGRHAHRDGGGNHHVREFSDWGCVA